MEIQKARFDSTLQAAQSLGFDTLKKNIDDGRQKLGAAATELAAGGSFADVKSFSGDPASKKESMSNLNTDLAAWNKELTDRQANQEWANNLDKRLKEPENRPTPEQLNSGVRTENVISPFAQSVEKMYARLAKVAETGLEKDALFHAINGVKFTSDFAFGDGEVGESIMNAAFGTTSWTPESTRTGLIPVLPRHDPILPSILPVVTWSQAAYPYVQEKSALVGTGGSGALADRGDADRAEGDAAVEATLEMELVTEPITSKAFTLPVHSELVEDVPGSRAHVTSRMPMLMMDVLNNSLLNGSRASNKGIVGFLNRSGTRSFDFANQTLSAATQARTLAALVAIHKGIVDQVGNSAAYPDMMLFNIQLYHQIKMARDTDGRLLLGDYAGRGTDMLFGVPFTFHPNMPVNANDAKVGLMGAFRSHSAYISRKGLTLAYTESNADEFTKLIGRYRIDTRHGLALYRPAAFTEMHAGSTF